MKVLVCELLRPQPVGPSWMPGGAATPSKFAELEPEHFDDETPRRASRGQVLILFALFLTGMMGMLGLATDVGVWAVARRTSQGAADAGAFAGARQIAAYNSQHQVSALAEVTAAVNANRLASYTNVINRCEYIDKMWSVVGTCDQNVPSTAVGSRVGTTLTVPTFFMRALSAFGAPTSVDVWGYAKARVESAASVPSDAPLMVCGTFAYRTAGGTVGKIRLFASGSTTTVDQSLIGDTFQLTGSSQTDLKTKGVDCSAKDGKFAGVASGSTNAGKSVGSAFNYSTTLYYPTATTGANVDGAGGCDAGTSAPYNCVMIIPVADSSSSNGTLNVKAMAAFKVSKSGNVLVGVLLYDYIIDGPGVSTGSVQTAWTRGGINPVVIRLIW